MASASILTLSDLQQHSSASDCWVAVHGKVWNVSDFLDLHPGGSSIILKYAGADATLAYDEIHAPDIISDTLPAEKMMGAFNLPSTDVLPDPVSAAPTAPDLPAIPASTDIVVAPAGKPELYSLISAYDFANVAKTELSTKAWAFYSSAATDLVTHRMNQSLLRRIMFRPRILRDVGKVSMKTCIMGCETSAPFFISPAAMAKLAHKDGELALARGAGTEDIIQCISSNASYSLSSIVEAGRPDQPFFLQLYVNSDRPKTAELLVKARDLGVKAILVTVDAPVAGKREADERVAAIAVAAAISGAVAGNDKKGGGMGRIMAQYVDKTLNWKDLKWIKEVSGLPVVLKGVQSAADAKMAVEWGADGIMLSNHGGRSLDTAQASILTLMELRKLCPEVFQKLEVYVDGGFERGTDILKALALGATAVGIGRPYLYSLVYGQEGVEHLTQILKDELETTLRLSGLTDVTQAHAGQLNTRDVDYLVNDNFGEEAPMVRPRARL